MGWQDLNINWCKKQSKQKCIWSWTTIPPNWESITVKHSLIRTSAWTTSNGLWTFQGNPNLKILLACNVTIHQLFMYIYVYFFIYFIIWLYAWMYVYVYMYVCMYACMYLSMYIGIYVCMHICIHTYIVCNIAELS